MIALEPAWLIASQLTNALGITVKALFGDCCTSDLFDHDEHMVRLAASLNIGESEHPQSQTSAESVLIGERRAPDMQHQTDCGEVLAPIGNINSSQATTASLSAAEPLAHRSRQTHVRPVIDLTFEDHADSQRILHNHRTLIPGKRSFDHFTEHEEPHEDVYQGPGHDSCEDIGHLLDSQGSSISARAMETRQTAFNAMIDGSCMSGWNGLLSTTNNHTHLETELGEG